MKNLVFCIPLESGKEHHLRRTYKVMLSPEMVGVYDQDLSEGVLWVLRDTRSGTRLSAKLCMVSADVLEEGPQRDNIVAEADIDRSYYYEPTNDIAARSWIVNEEDARKFPRGCIGELNEYEVNALELLAKRSIERHLRGPNRAVLDLLNHVRRSTNILTYATALVHALKEEYSVGDLYLNLRDSEQLSVYESTALFYLREHGGLPGTSANDVICGYASTKDGQPGRSETNPPSVDTYVREIDPNEVVARRYLKRNSMEEADSWWERLQKTDHAEKRHQEILRDISFMLKARGIRPMETRSADLMIELESGFGLYEIKSANKGNLFEQAAKGATQALHYRYALTQRDMGVYETGLIIESCGCTNLEAYVASFLNSMGVITIFYHAEKEWPERVAPLGHNSKVF